MSRTAPQDFRWLALIATLPTEDPAARMRVLRTLNSLGAAMVRDGVFLLPDTGANRQALEHLSDYIIKGTGSAWALQVSPMATAMVATQAQKQDELRQLFDRSARYDDLVKTIESLKVGFGLADPSAISRVLHKQRREFETISGLDFFPNASRERASAALAEAEAAVRKLMFPTQGGAETRPGAGERMLGRTWATRRPLWADRLACAWLIRRFIDPEASMLWLEKSQDCPDSCLSFGFEASRFGNSETRVTFEQLLSQFDLAQNSALVKIGSIVHYLEVRGTPVPEAAGVQTLLQGALRRSTSDDELLHETEKTFDLLYEAYCEPAGR